MGGVSSNITPFTVTPRYKDDADHPWVTKQGAITISVWMSPRTTMTLEDVALLIEQFAANTISQQLKLQSAANPVANATNKNLNYQGEINSMTFRGQIIERAQMATYPATEYLRDGEKFNLFMTQRVSVCCVLV